MFFFKFGCRISLTAFLSYSYLFLFPTPTSICTFLLDTKIYFGAVLDMASSRRCYILYPYCCCYIYGEYTVCKISKTFRTVKFKILIKHNF